MFSFTQFRLYQKQDGWNYVFKSNCSSLKVKYNLILNFQDDTEIIEGKINISWDVNWKCSLKSKNEVREGLENFLVLRLFLTFTMIHETHQKMMCSNSYIGQWGKILSNKTCNEKCIKCFSYRQQVEDDLHPIFLNYINMK